MAMYNSEKTLVRCLDSLFTQTFTDWELIICDDCSQDNSYQLAQEYANKYDKIILLRNDRNLGAGATRNNCIKRARGKFIAVQDADDESLPTRLEKELYFLNENPEYAIVSVGMIQADEFGDWGKWLPAVKRPTKFSFVFHIPHSHGACMVRKEAFDAVGGYPEGKRYKRGQDYFLFAKMYAAGYYGYNIPEFLYRWYDDSAAYQRRTIKARWNGFFMYKEALVLLKIPFFYRMLAITRMLTRRIVICLLPPLIYHWIHRRKKLNK